MILFRTALLIILALAITSMAPTRAHAQIPIAGKTLTYRIADSDSHQELYRTRMWETVDSNAPAWLTLATFPNGANRFNECVFANGYDRPATSSRSILFSASGELERKDFDTFDPTYYPFLSSTVSADMQPGSCLGKGGLNLATVLNGGKVGFQAWTDSGFIGLNFRREDAETLNLPAGRFDAIRIGVDVDLGRLFPHMPALVLKLFTPTVKFWITKTEPFYILKMVGLGDGGSKHPHTVIELASIEDPSAKDSSALAEVHQGDSLPQDPTFALANSGSFVQGERSGHITMSSATVPEGMMVDAKISYTDGIVIENRELIDHRAQPPARYIEDRTFSRDGSVKRRHQLFFRSAAFPTEPEKTFPSDLYGADMTLGMVLPGLVPEVSDTTVFHVMDWYGQVNELEIRRDGETTVPVGSAEASAIHCKLKPRVEVPILLRPIAYFLIPSFDLDFDANPGHRVLKVEGPFGPPGAPVAHMIGDEKIPSVATTAAK